MRVLLASIVPPRNDSGARVLMHRHLVERRPFELHVASSADFESDLLIHTRIRMPWVLEKIRKSRFGPLLRRRILDFQNFVWPGLGCRDLEEAVEEFQPDVILTLAEPTVAWMALGIAKRRGIPFAAFFMDWFPIMDAHYGMASSRGFLDKRFRELYRQSDLAFCICEGMRKELGEHSNSHVLYPMAGKHAVGNGVCHAPRAKFRLVYVGIALGFYGRMLQSLVQPFLQSGNLELIIVGPVSDWEPDALDAANRVGMCLGYKPPDEAAEVLREADALLVVMSFEREHELFMRTSFNTKFADYTTFGKPIVFWAPDYAAPMEVARLPNAAIVVNSPEPTEVLDAVSRLSENPGEREKLVEGSRALREGILNPDRLQGVFVGEIDKLAQRNRK